MSPTVLRQAGYRLFFFSREEARAHVHVTCDEGEAKFWLEPVIALGSYTPGLAVRRVREMQAIVEEHFDDITAAWRSHFGPRG